MVRVHGQIIILIAPLSVVLANRLYTTTKL